VRERRTEKRRPFRNLLKVKPRVVELQVPFAVTEAWSFSLIDAPAARRLSSLPFAVRHPRSLSKLSKTLPAARTRARPNADQVTVSHEDIPDFMPE